MSDTGPRFFGLYSGTVLINIDPLGLGRLVVRVPAVLGAVPSTWARPCLPAAGRQSGTYVVPEPNAGVWVAFEGGDPEQPVWMGCWWGSRAEVPALAQAAPPVLPPIVLQTSGQTTLMLSDVPGPTGGVLLKTAAGAVISISDAGIVISNGQGASISLIGPTVAINGTALVVT